ncbi:MAG: alpha/beta hydrolase [Rhodobacteraceae bacterium]|nr:alpha/beta hydrolase [Paracoccaceae bacterium]
MDELQFHVLPNGVRLGYRQLPGKDPGVVFLHGLRSNMDGTKADFLRQHCERSGRAYLRFDMSGHGVSGGEFSDFTMSDWFQEAQGMLADLANGPQVLVGSSMGAWLALLIAERFPEHVAGLVGIASAPDFTVVMEAEFTQRQLSELESAGYIDLPTEYDDVPTRLTREFFLDAQSLLVANKRIPVSFPVRLLHGTDDEDVDLGIALDLLGNLDGPDARLTLVKGADHRMSDGSCLELLSEAIDSIEC